MSLHINTSSYCTDRVYSRSISCGGHITCFLLKETRKGYIFGKILSVFITSFLNIIFSIWDYMWGKHIKQSKCQLYWQKTFEVLVSTLGLNCVGRFQLNGKSCNLRVSWCLQFSLSHCQVSASVVSTGATGGVVISPSPSPSCLSAASSIDNLTTPLSDITVAGATGAADGASGSDRKEGESMCRHKLCPKSEAFFFFLINFVYSENPVDWSLCLCSSAWYDHQPVLKESRFGTSPRHLSAGTGTACTIFICLRKM